jgi:hypothetical protein
MLLNRYPETFVSYEHGHRRHRPVIAVNIPDNPTERLVSERIAAGLVSNSVLIETYGKSRSKLYSQLECCGVKVIAFDNCQRVYNAGDKTKRILRDMFCDISDRGIHLALFGAKPMIAWVKGNEHLFSRIPDTIAIKPFADNEIYRKLLDLIERVLPFPEPSRLREFARDFHVGSGGRIGRTIFIARRCGLISLEKSETRITKAVLADVLEDLRKSRRISEPKSPSP